MHTRQRLHYVMSSRACYVEPSYAGEVRDVRDKLINDDDEPPEGCYRRHAIWQLPCRSIHQWRWWSWPLIDLSRRLAKKSDRVGQEAARQDHLCFVEQV